MEARLMTASAALRRTEGEAAGSVRMPWRVWTARDEFFGFFAKEEGAVVLGAGEGVMEGRRIAPPVGDGIAVDAGLFRGDGQVRATGQGGNDSELLGRESEVEHRGHVLVSR
jgi:hypothetical protein